MMHLPSEGRTWLGSDQLYSNVAPLTIKKDAAHYGETFAGYRRYGRTMLAIGAPSECYGKTYIGENYGVREYACSNHL